VGLKWVFWNEDNYLSDKVCRTHNKKYDKLYGEQKRKMIDSFSHDTNVSLGCIKIYVPSVTVSHKQYKAKEVDNQERRSQDSRVGMPHKVFSNLQ